MVWHLKCGLNPHTLIALDSVLDRIQSVIDNSCVLRVSDLAVGTRKGRRFDLHSRRALCPAYAVRLTRENIVIQTHEANVLHERRPVTTDMAYRLARAFGTSPEMWLGLQQDVDLWDTLHERRAEYERIQRLETCKAA